MVELHGITWDHPRAFGPLVAAADEWRAHHPDVIIEWSARSLQAFADEPLESLAAHYDLMIVDHPHVPAAHDAGLLLALDGTGHDGELAALSAQSVGPSHRSYAYRGHQYGLAIDAAAQVAVYRPDLIDGPPRDWDEVFALAEAGGVLWAAKPVDAISTLMTLAANAGHPVAEHPEEFLEEGAGMAALETMHRLAALVPEWCLDANPIEVAEALADAEADAWRYSPLAYGYTNYSRAGYRSHRLRYVGIPSGPRGVRGSCLGGAGIAVSASSRHPDEAVTHAFWLASDAVQRGVYYPAGGQPGYAGAWDDVAVNEDCLDFFRATRATLEGAWLRPQYAGWIDAFNEIGVLVNRALRGQISDRAMLREAQRRYEHSRSPMKETGA